MIKTINKVLKTAWIITHITIGIYFLTSAFLPDTQTYFVLNELFIFIFICSWVLSFIIILLLRIKELLPYWQGKQALLRLLSSSYAFDNRQILTFTGLSFILGAMYLYDERMHTYFLLASGFGILMILNGYFYYDFTFKERNGYLLIPHLDAEIFIANIKNAVILDDKVLVLEMKDDSKAIEFNHIKINWSAQKEFWTKLEKPLRSKLSSNQANESN